MSEQSKIDAERAAFEAWYLQKFFEGDKQCGIEWLSTEPCGGYRYAEQAHAWLIWQARASLQVGVPDVSELQRLLDDVRDVRSADDVAFGWYEAVERMLAAAPTVKPSFADDPRKPHELSAEGCRCVRFGEGNPHWPCPIHAAPTVKAEQVHDFDVFWNSELREELRKSCARGWAELIWKAATAAARFNFAYDASLPAAGSAVQAKALRAYDQPVRVAIKMLERTLSPTAMEIAAELRRCLGDAQDALSAQQSAPERVSVLCEALEDARRAMFAVLNQEPRMKAVAKRVLNAEIGRIDRALLASHGRGEA